MTEYTMTFKQETILAMELGRSHIGKLVQIITDSWSLTGTLRAVSQHDNREWSVDYSRGRRLVPSGGEIYAVLHIGPWEGQVIGNQPVTVETVAGTLEAPERARSPLEPWTAEQVARFDNVTQGVIEGRVLGDLPPAPAEWPDLADPEEPRPWLAANGNRFSAAQAKLITERLTYRPEGVPDHAGPDDPHPELPC